MSKKLFWTIIIFIILSVVAAYFTGKAHAGEKEELSLEWRALVAEYNLAFERFKQASPEFKALREFRQRLEVKGFMIENGTGKIVEKPKVKNP